MLPTSPTTVLNVVPAYVYYQYSDDQDIQAFNTSYNDLTQGYLNWFNNANLPVYTVLEGQLLDWMASGLYGYARPALTYGFPVYDGTYNTYAYNTTPYNVQNVIQEPTYTFANDDAYKRCLTWHFYKDDGRQFTIPWLKRRIQRFLQGVDGAGQGISQTYQISITFGVGNVVNINIITAYKYLNRGMYNTFEYNSMAFNDSDSTLVTFTQLAYAENFKSAVLSGALELPFQYTYVVNIEPPAIF